MEEGIWVRMVLDNFVEVTGFAAGADSPNDFWITFKTQLVHLDRVRETRPTGEVRDLPKLYVNRDRISMVEVVQPPADVL